MRKVFVLTENQGLELVRGRTSGLRVEDVLQEPDNLFPPTVHRPSGRRRPRYQSTPAAPPGHWLSAGRSALFPVRHFDPRPVYRR